MNIKVLEPNITWYITAVRILSITSALVHEPAEGEGLDRVGVVLDEVHVKRKKSVYLIKDNKPQLVAKCVRAEREGSKVRIETKDKIYLMEVL